MMRHVRHGRKIFSFPLVLLLGAALSSSPAWSQTHLEPGFNLFSPEQDVEIGRASAQEVEKQLPILKAPKVKAYVETVGRRLVQATPGPEYPYQFDLINAEEINAFALPGGFMYLNRGLIEAADTEAELAGVMAHEISHVALRHGTNQASKAYLAQAGFGILGGLLGQGTTSQIVGAIGGFGLNTLFLKFSRSAEKKADILGAQILARAGYDPMAMVQFFHKLQEESGRNPGKVEQFFSSHPAPENRARRVEEEIALLGNFQERAPTGQFASIKRSLDRLPPAPSERAQSPGQSGPSQQPGTIETPASTFQVFQQESGLFRVSYPENWSAYPGREGFGVTIVPQGGVVQTSQQRTEILYGVMVDHFQPTRGGNLDSDTQELVNQLLGSNRHLSVAQGSARREQLDGRPGLSLVLTGTSPVTGEQEQVTVFTRQMGDGHLLYALFIAPSSAYRALGNTFERMLSSLRVNDRVSHS